MNRSLLIGFVPFALGGCALHYNDSLALRDGVHLEALSPHQPSAAPADDQPSVTSVEREGWEPSRILVPVDGTAHNPTYVRVRPKVQRMSRQLGDYPTEMSSLELPWNTAGIEAWDAVRQPFRALGNAILLPIRVVAYRWPWDVMQSPREYHERAWDTPSARPVVTGTAPAPSEIPPPTPAVEPDPVELPAIGLPPAEPVTPPPAEPLPEPPPAEPPPPHPSAVLR